MLPRITVYKYNQMMISYTVYYFFRFVYAYLSTNTISIILGLCFHFLDGNFRLVPYQTVHGRWLAADVIRYGRPPVLARFC